MLSIVIPALNEERRLPATLIDIAHYLKTQNGPAEVIVVDDGSTDQTAVLSGALADRFDSLQVLRHETNQGKGWAVKTGVMTARGDYVLFMDADSSTPIAELDKLWPFASDHEVIIGSRHMHGANVVVKQPWYRIFISRLGNAMIRFLAVPGVRDTQCGFKLFQGAAAKALFSRQQIRGWGFDIELLTIASRVFGYSIKEVPVDWYDSDASRLRPIRDAWFTFRELIRIKRNLLANKYGPHSRNEGSPPSG